MHSDIAKTGSTGGNSSQTGNDCNSTLNTSIHDNAGAGDNFKVVKKEKHDKYYQCPRCTKSFSNQDTLTKHGRFFHNISVKFCTDCNLTFVDVSSRNGHMHKMHGGGAGSGSTSNKNIESSLLKITTPCSVTKSGNSHPTTNNRMRKMMKSEANSQIQLEQSSIADGSGT